jgi:hypothetical protein
MKRKEPDKKVVDIKTRRPRSDNPHIWELAKQIISMEDIKEFVAVLGDISSDYPDMQLLRDIPNTPEINERVHDILWEAVGQLERFEDSLKDDE